MQHWDVATQKLGAVAIADERFMLKHRVVDCKLSQGLCINTLLFLAREPPRFSRGISGLASAR